MFTIAVVNQKGGSGKSTLAECLAVAAHQAGRPSAILDLDPQGTAYAWSKRREADNPPVLSVTAASYRDQWEALREAGADLVILDTPARLQDTVLGAAAIADLIIVPAKTTMKDLERIESSVDLATTTSRKPVVVVFNQVRPQATRTIAATKALRGMDVTICPVRLGFRVAFEDADLTGETPLEIEPEGKAAAEIRKLYRFIEKTRAQIESHDAAGAVQDSAHVAA